MAMERTANAWQDDLVSLSRPFFMAFREGLREDFTGACELLGVDNISFAQRLEGTDLREIRLFADLMSSTGWLEFHRGTLRHVLKHKDVEEKNPDANGVAPWRQKFASIQVAYLMAFRDAVRIHPHLAQHLFKLDDQDLATQSVDLTLGDLVTIVPALRTKSVLQLRITVAAELGLDRVLAGGAEEELQICRMAHASRAQAPQSL